MSTAHEQTQRVAIICGGAFVTLNVAFYFLAGSYFDSHHELVNGVPNYSPAQMMHVRVTFAVFSGVVAAFAFAAGIRARAIGHLLPALLGILYLVFSIAAFVATFTHGAPLVVGVTLAVAGLLMPLLAWRSSRGSRPAWAFLIAMCGVFAIALLFGSPKVRSALDIGLWIAMILPGLNAVAASALISLSGEYVERDPVTA